MNRNAQQASTKQVMHPILNTPEAYDYGVRVAAAEAGTIMTRTGTRRIVLGPHIRVIGLITSPGDHAGLWGIAEAEHRPNITANILATGDPATYAGQHDLWEAIGTKWCPWIDATLAEGELPQIAVANREAAQRLAWSARRVATHPDTTRPARRAAQFVLTATHGQKTPGQQTVLIATDALREHYITGADPLDETHLGHWLEYPDRSPDWDREETGLAEAFEAPETRFGKAVDRMNATGGHMRTARAARIIPLLRPTLTARFDDIIAALDLLAAHPGPLMPVAKHRYKTDAGTVGRFWAKETTPGYRSIPARVRTLYERETLGEQWQKACWAFDPMERTRAELRGEVLTGTADGACLEASGIVRTRPGDRFNTTDPGDEKNTLFTVEDLAVTASGTTLVTFDDCLPSGEVALTPAVPSARPAPWITPTWVHSDQTGPTAPAPTSPDGGYTDWAESLKTQEGTQR